ncbi:MAG: glycosyltransferase family 4 protein [Paludibacter sp.]|nr:glycosyltransferase family 4 protein [Paludibacter sp.]
MKIVQIGSFPLDASCIKGGVEASVYGLAIEQAKKHEVVVIDVPRKEIRNDEILTQNGLKIHRYVNKGNLNVNSLFRISRIIKEIKQFNPEVCHIHTTSLFSLICYVLLSLKKYPTIVTVHGLAHIEKKNDFKKIPSVKNRLKYISQSLTEFLYLSICKNCIVDTGYVLDAILLYKRQHKVLKLPNCQVIPQGVNKVFFDIKSISQENELLAVGALNKRKGHLLLIEVMKQIVEKYPEYTLSIVGVQSDLKYFKAMQSKIKEYGLEDAVKLFPNATFDEILRMYSNAELFVLHTEEESQGIVFCEAMAAGKPIVATNVGGVPWVVNDGVNGLLCDYADIDTFAKNIIKLIEDKNLRLKMQKNNKQKSNTYKWETIEIKVMDIYKSII